MSADTRGKWKVLAFVFLVSLVTFLDRINISVAGPFIAKEFGFTNVGLGIVFGAFVFGYGLFQIPGGWLGDRLGHKRILILALTWWSLFTCLTPWAGNSFLVPLIGGLQALCLVRFLIGVGEAATYPCSGGLIGSWFKAQERGLASGVMLAGIGLGAAITPPLVAWFIRNWGWRSAFYISGAIGVALALAFHVSVRDRPMENHSTEEPQIPQYAAQPDDPCEPDTCRVNGQSYWRQIIENRDVWTLTLSNFLEGYVAYIYFFWFYIYLVEVRGFSLLRGSLFATLPFLALGLSAPLGGWLSDRLIPLVGKSRARRLVAMGGLVPAALLILAGARAASAYGAIACLGLAAGSLYMSIGCYWATATEIVPSHSGTVTAIMNTGANLGGTVSPVLTPWIAARYGWGAALGVAASFAFLAAFLWMFIGNAQLAPESSWS